MSHDRLKGIMREQRKTQRDLAECLGISLGTANAKLNGRSDFTLYEIKDILEWLQSGTFEDIFLGKKLQ